VEALGPHDFRLYAQLLFGLLSAAEVEPDTGLGVLRGQTNGHQVLDTVGLNPRMVSLMNGRQLRHAEVYRDAQQFLKSPGLIPGAREHRRAAPDGRIALGELPRRFQAAWDGRRARIVGYSAMSSRRSGAP